MIENTTGVVLRTQRYSETSLIVRWLTPDLGRVSTIAKGARRAKSPFAGKLDLFIEAQLSLSRSVRSDLHTLREVFVTRFHLPLRDNVDRLRVAAYAVALIEQTTESDTPLPDIHALFCDLLTHLTSTEPRPRLVFAFELKLLTLLGLSPAPGQTALTANTQALLRSLVQDDWDRISRLTPKPQTVQSLARFLQGFLMYHLGRIPPLRSALLKGPVQ